MKSKRLGKTIFTAFLLIIVIIPALVYPQKKTKKEIIIESQIPKEQLTSLSTRELLEKCLEYPYMADVMFAQDIPLMFKYIRQEFNGLDEFFSRKDAPGTVLYRFQNFDYQKINQFEKSYERGLYTFKFCYLNLLLAQDEIIRELGDNYNIIRQIHQKYSELKDKNLEPFESSITTNFVGFNLLKYLENTESGKSAELAPFVASSRTMNISSLDSASFEYLFHYVSENIRGK